MVVRRLSDYCKTKGLLPKEWCKFRPDRSITDMMFVVRRLQDIGRETGVSLFMCFIDLQNAYNIVDRTFLWQVLTCVRIPPEMIAVIRQFYDGMRACVQPDDGICLDWFELEQGLRQECVLSPPVFNIFFGPYCHPPPKVQRGYGHSSRAGAPKGTSDVDRDGVSYGLRSLCGVGVCYTRMTPAQFCDRRRGSRE